MREYHKIQSVFKRDTANNMKTFLLGEWSMPEFGYLANNEWEFTEKVDGTNLRVIVEPGGIRLGGKTDLSNLHKDLVSRLQERFLPQSEALHEMFPGGVCLYGEGYGAGIQKGGGNYRQDKDFVLFDVWVPVSNEKPGRYETEGWWLRRDNVEEIAKNLSLDVVPIIGRGTLADAVAMAKLGFHSQWGAFMAEGIVARPSVELRGRNGQRIITKVKHKDFQ